MRRSGRRWWLGSRSPDRSAVGITPALSDGTALSGRRDPGREFQAADREHRAPPRRREFFRRPIGDGTVKWDGCVHEESQMGGETIRWVHPRASR